MESSTDMDVQRKSKCIAFDKFFFFDLWKKDLKNRIWWK